jgi:hypothetical protein
MKYTLTFFVLDGHLQCVMCIKSFLLCEKAKFIFVHRSAEPVTHLVQIYTEQNIIFIVVKSIYKGLLPKQHIKYKTKETVNCTWHELFLISQGIKRWICVGWSLTVCYVHQVIFALWEGKIYFCSPVCRTSNPPSTNIHVNYLNV